MQSATATIGFGHRREPPAATEAPMPRKTPPLTTGLRRKIVAPNNPPAIHSFFISSNLRFSKPVFTLPEPPAPHASPYWHIGPAIVQHQEAEGWGTKVIDNLAVDFDRPSPTCAGCLVQILDTCR
jgi:hypothetical protein